VIRDLLWHLLWLVNGTVLAYFLLLNGAYLLTNVLALGALHRHVQRMKAMDAHELITDGGALPITLIAPAYNEEATCVEAVRSLLTLNYPHFEIVVVNDGSKDRTAARMIEGFDMEPASRLQMADFTTGAVQGTYRSRWHPNLWLIDKANGGKADALNCGLNYCQTPLFCAMDADTLLERDALIRIVRPFLEDNRTIAAGGIIRIANGCKVDSGIVTDVRLPDSWTARFQVLEYLRAFLGGRMGWHALRATLIISGAFGVFRRSAAVEVGGFRTDVVGEDMELVVRLHRHFRERGEDYRIDFVPDPVAWTEAPESLAVLARQRDRWQRGLSETLTIHRGMVLNPRYGRIGLLAAPYFFFLEMLGPAIEIAGYLAFLLTLLLGWATTRYILLFLLLAIGFGMALSIFAVAMEERGFRRYRRISDLSLLFGLAVLENFGYRQLTTYWRARGMISFLRKKKGWGEMVRKGFQTHPTGESG